MKQRHIILLLRSWWLSLALRWLSLRSTRTFWARTTSTAAGAFRCHQPHSGSAGAGGTDTSTGTIVLWGMSFLGKTYTTDGGITFTTYPTVASFVNGTKDPLYRTAICLTCHDGSASCHGHAWNHR